MLSKAALATSRKWLLSWAMVVGCGTTPAQSHVPRPNPVAATSSTAVASAPTPTPPPSLTDEEACALPIAGSTAAVLGAKPFTQPDAPCSASWDCDFVDKAPASAGSCFVANDNIAKAERASRARVPKKAASNHPWDGSSKPQYLDRIDAHLHLTDVEQRLLRKNGFVVLDRLPYVSYAAAFHDIYQEQLPLYVGIDPILHALFRGTERALERVERKKLVPALASLLSKLRRGLKLRGKAYDAQIRADLDQYLGVAWLLNHGHEHAEDKDPSLFSKPEPIRTLGALVDAGELTEVSLFGRQRMVDFSQLRPRGHYALNVGAGFDTVSLEPYFRTVMWLSRLELNLVSRDSRSSQPGAVPNPAETPREVRVALALAEIVAATGATKELQEFESIYSAFAGRREDVSMPALSKLARQAGTRAMDADAPGKLKKAIGGGYVRTANMHFMPQGVTKLPVIATLLGPRIAPDVAPLNHVVHDKVPDRLDVGAADVAYMLGHDRAEHYLAPDLRVHPNLAGALAGGRTDLATNTAKSSDLYGSWLRTILALGRTPTGVVPSFMRRHAHADARMNSALVGYGQLRHAFVLLAAQGYDMYGCEIPDAYVEPLPEVYDAMLAHVRAMRTHAKGWAGLERVLSMLQVIVKREVEGVALSEPQKRWLAMVSEHIPLGGFMDTGAQPQWTGWYFDMFDDRELGANRTSAFVADYFTLTNKNEIAYLGADGPRLGVFVVDVGGKPRAMVGPVAKGYEARQGPIHERLDDASARGLGGKKAAWRASYAVAPRPEPTVGLAGNILRCDRPSGPEWILAVRGDQALDAVRVTLLDHHGDAITQPLAVTVSQAWRAYRFDLPASVAKSSFGVEGYHVRLEDPAIPGGYYDHFTSPTVYIETGDDLPMRRQGMESFAIGVPARAQE